MPFSNAVSAPSAPPECRCHPVRSSSRASSVIAPSISGGVCLEPISAYTSPPASCSEASATLAGAAVCSGPRPVFPGSAGTGVRSARLPAGIPDLVIVVISLSALVPSPLSLLPPAGPVAARSLHCDPAALRGGPARYARQYCLGRVRSGCRQPAGRILERFVDVPVDRPCYRGRSPPSGSSSTVASSTAAGPAGSTRQMFQPLRSVLRSFDRLTRTPPIGSSTRRRFGPR